MKIKAKKKRKCAIEINLNHMSDKKIWQHKDAFKNQNDSKMSTCKLFMNFFQRQQYDSTYEYFTLVFLNLHSKSKSNIIQ